MKVSILLVVCYMSSSSQRLYWGAVASAANAKAGAAGESGQSGPTGNTLASPAFGLIAHAEYLQRLACLHKSSHGRGIRVGIEGVGDGGRVSGVGAARASRVWRAVDSPGAARDNAGHGGLCWGVLILN